MSLDSLAERMNKLREESNTSSRSEDQTPTPLWVFLYICENSKRAYYTDYMAGAKALAKYLAPISIPLDTYIRRVPDMLCSYETQELAKVLNTSQDIIIHTLIELRREGKL